VTTAYGSALAARQVQVTEVPVVTVEPLAGLQFSSVGGLLGDADNHNDGAISKLN
jgi:hypothetical protein